VQEKALSRLRLLATCALSRCGAQTKICPPTFCSCSSICLCVMYLRHSNKHCRRPSCSVFTHINTFTILYAGRSHMPIQAEHAANPRIQCPQRKHAKASKPLVPLHQCVHFRCHLFCVHYARAFQCLQQLACFPLWHSSIHVTS